MPSGEQTSCSVTFSMVVQTLQDCNFNVAGSYSNVVSFNLVANFYLKRPIRTITRSSNSEISPQHQLPDLLVKAERLQRTITDLSGDLKLSVGSGLEYDDLVNALDEIAEKTIPYILRFSIDSFSHQLGRRCESRVLSEIAYMQGILEGFARKQVSNTDRLSSSMPGTFTVDGLLELLWAYFWYLFYARYFILSTRKSIIASRDRIYLILFEPMASSLANHVRRHHIEIVDFFGAQWTLPQDLCLNRQVFLSILRFKFHGGPAELVITSKQFTIFRQDGLRPVRAIEWEKTIKEGDDLQLSVLVNQRSKEATDGPGAKGQKCPQCERSDKLIHGSSQDGWVNCLRCNSTFNVAPVEPEDDDDEKAQKDQEPSDDQHRSSGSKTEQPKLSSIFRCFSITNPKDDDDTPMEDPTATSTGGNDKEENPTDAETQPQEQENEEKEITEEEEFFENFDSYFRKTQEREHEVTLEEPVTNFIPEPVQEGIETHPPFPIHGNGEPSSDQYAPFTVTTKRYRTLSQASMEVEDGITFNANTSDTDSIYSSTEGRSSPTPRDPIAAVLAWRNIEEAYNQVQGKRRRRPGVVFDVGVEDE